MPKSIYPHHSFVSGEISPRAFGRFEPEKPIFRSGAKLLENFLIVQLGGVFFRPGTVFVDEIKDSTLPAKLLRFEFSTTQAYVLELGQQYLRFFANSGRVENPPGTPVELSTVFLQTEVFAIMTAQKSDVMYLTHQNHPPQKLIRTSAIAFTISAAPIVRGPFLDKNVSATTITPSSDTGATTLTASTAIFLVGHIGSLWRVKSGVVKVTGFTSTTVVTGSVQAEPDGTSGNLATGPGAVTDWAEGAFSDVRGYPTSVVFHEERLYYGGPGQHFYGSVIGAYDNFAVGSATASDAVSFELASSQSSIIRWLASNGANLQLGTQAGTYSASSGSSTSPITPTNIQVVFDTDYGVATIAPHLIAGYLYYLQANLFQLRELIFNFYINRQEASDANLLADHILRDGSGVVDMERQQSPNDRIWVVRSDGQLAVLTRNTNEKVLGWSRLIAGSDALSAGSFETICILPQEGKDDQIWVVVKRTINGTTKRYVEYFNPEYFTNPWEPSALDCSLSLDSPKTITGATQANPVVVTATTHGFSNGDQIKIDLVQGMTQLNGNRYLVANKTANTFSLTTLEGVNVNGTSYSAYRTGGQARKMVTSISGLTHLNGETVSVVTDGALPSTQQTFVVSGGAITLPTPAAVVHVGLPYAGTVQLLKINDGQQTEMRRVYRVTLRLDRSLGLRVGTDASHLSPVYFQHTNDPLGASPALFTGDLEPSFDGAWDTETEFVLQKNDPLPLMILAVVLRSETESK